ncbi:hypothetical protein KC19_8G085000 [Ceratodon purpureus]|uniref:Uncharacterized protein n=1 Tax=Ceratodon purpureus TaxID=3225 RepID=A0A8T0H190_CERPU|nr:hypothetical protein KC19_8G085000 [Ceratodon purpureus]
MNDAIEPSISDRMFLDNHRAREPILGCFMSRCDHSELALVVVHFALDGFKFTVQSCETRIHLHQVRSPMRCRIEDKCLDVFQQFLNPLVSLEILMTQNYNLLSN